ncbi:MAG: hypothetical protein IJT34_01355 [Butyrivibrio sp.]|nr:hypothetical protein [Butyrivibrio sp.]
MNNQLYPFERNRYYPGKMLTSADFQAEQEYHINKNRFMNSLMYGAGIVCGLGVFSLDDLSILVESGVALDGTGREIIVDSSVVRKLSAIEGFQELKGDEATLCVRFKEDPVHAVYSVSHQETDKEYEYNRISEGYEIFLTDKKKKRSVDYELETDFLVQETIYKSENFLVQIVMPAVVSKGRNVRFMLTVKKLSDAEVRLSVRGTLEIPAFLTPAGAQEMEVGVEDLRLNQGEDWKRDYWITVQDIEAIDTNVILKSGSATAFENDTAQQAVQSFTQKIRLSEDSPLELVNDEIGRMNLEMRGAGGEKNLIRLADIKIARTDNSYLIESVVDSGRRKHIAAPAQALLRSHYIEFFDKDTELQGAKQGAEAADNSLHVGKVVAGPEVATGVLEIPLGRGARQGDIRYSGEIAHGLGKGNVYVDVGYEYISSDRSLGGNAKSTIYGDPALFNSQSKDMINVQTAVRVLNDKGSFVVAAKLLQNVDFLVLTFRWVAVRFPAGNDLELVEDFYDKSITAQTPTVTMGVKESHFFGVQFNNMKACSITYELTAPSSGEITADGIYTAPAKEGVYEIHIYCTDMPVVCTYAYAIVKRRENMNDNAPETENAAALDLESRMG